MQFTRLLAVLLIARYICAQDACPGLPMWTCEKNNTVVRCRNWNLTEIPSGIPPTVEQLYIPGTSIVRIDAYAFPPLNHLHKLMMYLSHITFIEDHAFGNLASLKILDLTRNDLTEINKHTLSGLKGLEELHIPRNFIKRIDEHAFDDLNNLKKLILNENFLISIPEIGYMPFLSVVKDKVHEGPKSGLREPCPLRFNSIQNATLPMSFRNSSNLRDVDLEYNKIKYLDYTTFRASSSSNLTVKLSYNHICTYVTCDFYGKQPGKISIASLHFLSAKVDIKNTIDNIADVGMNSLLISNGYIADHTFSAMCNKSIDTMHLSEVNASLTYSTFVCFPKLTTLTVESSKCSAITQNAFSGLDHVREMNLSWNKGNKVTSFEVDPTCLKVPPTLKRLHMYGNELWKHVSFKNNRDLTELDLLFDFCVELVKDSFVGLERLSRLNLTGTAIYNFHTLHQDLLYPLSNLTYLSLARMFVHFIKPGTFRSQTLVRYLDLSNNSPLVLEPKTFEGLTSIHELHLESNDFGKMFENESSSILFFGLENLKELYLTSNNIKALHGSTFDFLHSLELLKLDENAIANIDATMFKPTPNLLELDLSDNSIRNIQSVDNFPQNLKRFNLSNNQLACDCSLVAFRDWVRDKEGSLFVNESCTCSSPEEWMDEPLLSFNKTQLECLFLRWWALSLGCLVGAVLVFILACIVYRKRWWIKLLVYKMTRKRKARKRRDRDRQVIDNMAMEEDGPMFDAYVSCAEADNEWVDEHLLPGIDQGVDGGGEFRLYYEHRDGNPGRSMIWNIYENLEISRKFIVVLSQHYLNAMNKFELDLATDQMYEGLIEEIIVVHIQQGLPRDMIPKHLLHTMKRNRLLEWADNDNARALMKEQIKQALLDNRIAADRNVD